MRFLTWLLRSSQEMLQSGDPLGLLPCATGEATPDHVECFRFEKLQHKLWLVASKESDNWFR